MGVGRVNGQGVGRILDRGKPWIRRCFSTLLFPCTVSAMGRLKAGQAPTPYNERMKSYRKNLVESGGRRIQADLGLDGAKALEVLMERDGLSAKDAIMAALLAHARQKKLL